MESELFKEKEKTDTDSLLSSSASSSSSLFDMKLAGSITGAMVLFHFLGSLLSIGVLTGGIGIALIGFVAALASKKQVVAESAAAGFASAGIISVTSLLLMIVSLGMIGGWTGLTFLAVGPIVALGGALLGEVVRRKL